MNTVIITGVSRGLGRQLANTFLASNWRVIGTGRSSRPDDLDQAIMYYQFDASDAAAVDAFWHEISQDTRDQPISLVNNAGGFAGGKLLETKAEDYVQQMQSNYFAGVNMVRGVVGHFEEARIINIISSAALGTSSGASAYGASKAAAAHFYHSLQKELASDHYQITNIYPNFINSNGDSPQAISPDDLAQFVVAQAELRASYYVPDVTLFANPTR